MQHELTPRQIQLLKAIIEEYIETAEAVGSETLDKKYNLGVSPATIRNEMVKLTQIGYLKQPHTSAGRVPTPTALRLYVNQLMKAKELSVADEVSVKQKMMDSTSKLDKLLREATRALAVYTHTMSLATTDTGDVYSAGMGNILEMPEFFDIDITKHLLETLDEYEYWWNVCMHCRLDSDNLAVLLGEELGSRFLLNCGGVFVRFNAPPRQGMIGVVGPTRLNFQRVVPMVRYIGHLISDISQTEGKE